MVICPEYEYGASEKITHIVPTIPLNGQLAIKNKSNGKFVSRSNC